MGLFDSFSEAFPGKIKFEGPGDQSGKVAIITGGNSGIGYETCKLLLSNGARVYMASRSQSKAEEAIAQLKKEAGKEDIHYLWLDLSSLESVNSAAAAFLAKESTLHMLFCNAGVLYPDPGAKSKEGYELSFATAVLGHHVFTMALESALANAGGARVITTGSLAHKMAKDELKFGMLDDPQIKERGTQPSWKLYCREKLGNSIWTHAMSKRFTDKKIGFYTVHPGFISTPNLIARLPSRILCAIIGHPPSSGGAQLVWVATTDELKLEDSGSYYGPWMELAKESAAATDKEQADRLWEWCEERRKLAIS